MIINKVQVRSFFVDIVKIQKPKKYLPAGVIPLLTSPIDFKVNELPIRLNYSYIIKEQIYLAVQNEI